MSKAIIVLLSMILLSVILLVLSICFLVKAKKKQKNCTQKTVGTVFRYSQGDDIMLPVVEYFVDGKRYTGKRKWRVYKTVQSSFTLQSSAKSNEQKDSLSVKGNYSIFGNPVAELYPIGKKLDVFYNPNKPKQNYVELIDKKPSVVGEVMFFAGIGDAILGILMYILIINVK